MRRSAAFTPRQPADLVRAALRRERHGGGAGKTGNANRRRYPAPGRQCRRCRGRHRLCAGGELSARRKYRRRRLYGDPFRRPRPGCRDRLPRDRAGCDDARYFPRPRRQARSRQVAQLGARHRRARNCRGTCAGAGKIRLRQFYAGADHQARDRSCARRFCRRRRHRRYAARHVSPDGALAQFGKDRFRIPTARRCARATG